MYKIVKKKYPYLRYNSEIELMKISDYNKMAKSLGLNRLTLDDNHYVVVANYPSMKNIKDEALKRRTVITINNTNYYPKYSYSIDVFYDMTSNASNVGFIVLPDEALDKATKYMYYKLADYKGNREKVDKVITNLMDSKEFSNS